MNPRLFQSKTPPRVEYVPPPAPPAPSGSAELLAQLAAARSAGKITSSQYSSDVNALAALGGAAGLAGSLGIATGELGTFLTVNPYTAIPAAALLIADLAGLVPSFAGKPKLLDTAQAATRLLSSPFVPLQQLGQRLAIFVKNGVPLSTGDPKFQQQIQQAIAGTVATIQAQYPGASAGQLDTLIRRALTSEQGIQGINQLNQVLARSALSRSPASSPPALPPALPSSAPLPPVIPSGAPATSSQPGFLKQSFQWLAQSGLLGGLPRLAAQDAEQLGHCILDFIRGGTVHALACVGELLARQVEQAAKDFLNAVLNAMRGQSGTQPSSPPPAPILAPQPFAPLAPLLEHKPCEACMTPGQRAQLQRERDQLRTEIQTEQQQNTTQQLDQVQQKLDQLRALESQPLEGRNVAQELQQKQQLAAELDQLDQTDELLQSGNQPLEPVPPGKQAPLLREQPVTVVERELEQAARNQLNSEPMQFCVGCQSAEDAVLFLNGEASACSVIPGTTKPILIPGGTHG